MEQKVQRLEVRVSVLEEKTEHQKVRQGAHDELMNRILDQMRKLSTLVGDQKGALSGEVGEARKEMEEGLRRLRTTMLQNGWGLVAVLITTLLGLVVALAK